MHLKLFFSKSIIAEVFICVCLFFFFHCVNLSSFGNYDLTAYFAVGVTHFVHQDS